MDILLAPRSTLNAQRSTPNAPRSTLFARVILTLDVSPELRWIEVDFAQIPRRVALRLVVEMWRLRMPTLATGGHGNSAHAVPELDDGDEAVAARAVPLLRVGIRPRPE